MKKLLLSFLFLLPLAGICLEDTVPKAIAMEEAATARKKSSKKSSSKSKTTSKTASSKGKRWTGATSIADFKSKINGTTWGSTRKRGDFYWKFEIKNDKIYITSYLTSDFDPAGKIGGTLTEVIDQWREKDGKVFAIVAYFPGADKNDWSTIPTVLGFSKNSSSATWGTVDGTIPLVQIL